MKKWLMYGTAVLALSAPPLVAQQSSGSGSRQSSPAGTSSDASGGTQSQPGSAADGSKANPDRQFVMDAAQGGMAEVDLGQLAGEKASSNTIKQFGQRMATDHGKANDELKTLAQNKGITLPSDMGARHKATKDRLSKLSGAAFDRAYMQEMVNDHRKDISELRKEAESGKDADVKAWAAKTLPNLEEHLRLAQEASQSAVGTSGSDKTTGDAQGGGTGTLKPRPAGSEPTGRPAPGAGIGSPR